MPVVGQRHVVALVDTDAAVGAVVRRDVVDVDVATAPDRDRAAGESKTVLGTYGWRTLA